MSRLNSQRTTHLDVRQMEITFSRIRADLRYMKENMATRKDIERVLGAIESFAAKNESGERAPDPVARTG